MVLVLKMLKYLHLFTFQSGDIRIIPFISLLRRLGIFTFQSGDIRIKNTDLLRQKQQLYLHSNLVIFELAIS